MEDPKNNLCLTCSKRKVDFKIGLICSLDNLKYTKTECNDYEADQGRIEKLKKNEKEKKSNKSSVKILLIIVSALLVILSGLYYYAKITERNKYIDDSEKLANIIEKEPIDVIKDKLKGKVYLLSLGNQLRDTPYKVQKNKAGMQTLVNFFLPYKKDTGYIKFKRYYFDKSKRLHLVFLVSDMTYLSTNIYDITTQIHEDGEKTVITDFYSYSRGEWEGIIQSNYFTIAKPNSTKLNPYVSHIRKMNSYSNLGMQKELLDYIEKLPGIYKEQQDVKDAFLEVSLTLSLKNDTNYFSHKANQILQKEKSKDFKLIWHFRKALYEKDFDNILKYSEMIEEITGEDPVFDTFSKMSLIENLIPEK